MNKLVFLHKHELLDVVSNLDFIQGMHFDTCVASLTDYQMADHFSDKDLAALYLNTTGDVSPYFGSQLRMSIMELADMFPVTDCFPGEVELQAQYVEAQPKLGTYYYVKGARIPTQAQPVLFPKIPFSTQDSKNAAARLIKRAAQLASAASAVPVAGATAAPAARNTVHAARPRSGVCKQIWETLDLDVKMTGVIPPRTRAKELALKNGWHLSTAGTQYAAWRKTQSAP